MPYTVTHKVHTSFSVSRLSPSALFLRQGPIWAPTLPLVLGFLLAETVSQIFLVLVTLTVLRGAGGTSCRTFLKRTDWSESFRVAGLESSILGVGYRRGQVPFSMRQIAVAVGLDGLASALTVKVLPPPPTTFGSLWKEVTVHSSHLRDGEVRFPSLRAE